MTNDKNKPIDLSSMENFEIEPSWVKRKNDSNAYKHTTGKDRGSQRDKRKGGDRSSTDQRRTKPKHGRGENPRKAEPRFEFQLLPEREILEKIKLEMRKTGISYGLSDICETILTKGVRYSVKIRFKEEQEKSFTITIDDQKIFSSDEKAVDHLLKNNFDKCFSKELDLEEKPIKNFSYVYQCTKTDVLLPPNNYHRYEEIVRQHMFLNGINEDFERFSKDLVKIDDPEQIKVWTEKPLKIYKFSIKKEEDWCKGIDQLRAKLLREMPSSLFVKEVIIKINGSKIKLLESIIKEQFIQYYNFKPNWINQLFSTCLVNLKKSNFTIFKYSEKKHTYACAYKRNKVEEKQLSKNAQKILSLLKKSKESKKAALLKDKNLEALGSKDILVELKWMVKEGYIIEFANGSIAVN
jgi:hypothetical protein